LLNSIFCHHTRVRRIVGVDGMLIKKL